MLCQGTLRSEDELRGNAYYRLKGTSVFFTVNLVDHAMGELMVTTPTLSFVRSQGATSLGVSLSELRLLWQLYNASSADLPEAGTMVSPVVRALTELFFVAENLALVSVAVLKSCKSCF